MMLMPMKRELYESFDEEQLSWTCIEPAIAQVRGKDRSEKSRVYNELTGGQKALFMFRIYHDHAYNSMDEFYMWTSVLIGEPKTWPEIKTGLRYIENSGMLSILENVESLILEQARGSESEGLSPGDLNRDAELRASVERLYGLYLEEAPVTKRAFGAFIRSHTGDFVQIENEHV